VDPESLDGCILLSEHWLSTDIEALSPTLLSLYVAAPPIQGWLLKDNTPYQGCYRCMPLFSSSDITPWIRRRQCKRIFSSIMRPKQNLVTNQTNKPKQITSKCWNVYRQNCTTGKCLTCIYVYRQNCTTGKYCDVCVYNNKIAPPVSAWDACKYIDKIAPPVNVEMYSSTGKCWNVYIDKIAQPVNVEMYVYRQNCSTGKCWNVYIDKIAPPGNVEMHIDKIAPLVKCWNVYMYIDKIAPKIAAVACWHIFESSSSCSLKIFHEHLKLQVPLG